jgi:hypothetical protein
MKWGESSKHRKRGAKIMRRRMEGEKERKQRKEKVKAMRKGGYEDNGEETEEAEQELNEVHWGWH